MGKKYLSLMLLILMALTSCAPPVQQAEPTAILAPAISTPTPEPTSEPTLPPTETPVVFALAKLVVESETLTAANDVFEFSPQINPGDNLRIEATVSGTVPGSMTLMGKTKEYKPGEETVFLLNIPKALGSKDIAIRIESADGSKLAYTLRLANPSAKFQPAVVADLPDHVYAGQKLTVSLTAQSVSGGDAFEIKAVKQVQGLGDKYTGKEYVTSQKLAELSLDGNNLSFLANTPGNYRVSATVLDGAETKDLAFDIPVYWEPGKSPFSIRGVAIDTWGALSGLNLNNIPHVIDIAASYGINYIQLNPIWDAVGTPTNHQLVPCTKEMDCLTPDDGMLRQWIQYAHAKNMKVLLKPHIVGGSWNKVNAYNYDFQHWQIKPSKPDQWFDDYTNKFLLPYAKIAQDEGVEMFAVGNELAFIQTDLARWTKVIDAVKQVYKGPLTYSDTSLGNIWPGQSMFWDQLDYIGIPYYYIGPNTKTPTVAQLEAAIKQTQASNLARAMKKFETKPVIATEFGRPNYDGVGRDYTSWSFVQDNQEAVDYMEAALNTMVDLGPRFNGMFIWDISTNPSAPPVAWDFQGKPLGEAIRFWFSH